MRTSTTSMLAGVILLWAAAAMPSAVVGQITRPHLREAASPYTAEYKITSTQRLADGNLINQESKEVIAVDSQRRRMTTKTGTLIPGGDPLGTRIIMFDPVARTTSIWTVPGQRVTVDAMSEPGAPRGCSAAAARGDVVNLGVARTSGPKPVVEDLGTETILGIEARGTRRTTTIQNRHRRMI